jgi:putative ABC transport system permease protein
MSWFSRLANVFRASTVDADLEEELRFHRDARVDDLMREGLSRDEAAAQASRQLGNALLLRETSRDVKLIPWLESVFKDVRFGLRVLRRDAVVTSAAVASLALAIGACAAAFSLVDALILRPLPVREPDRLIYLTYPTESNPHGEAFSYPTFARLREAAGARLTLFGGEQAARRRRATFHDASGQEEKVLAQYISGNSFEVLGVGPAAGRVLSASDDGAPGAHPVAVLSHAFWTRRFGQDASVVGRWFDLERRQLQVVGVAAEHFTGVEPGLRVDVWMPAAMYDAQRLADPGSNWFRILGRLHDGIDPQQARAILHPAFTAFRRDFVKVFSPDVPRHRIERFVRTPLEVQPAATGPSALRRQFERALWILAVIVALVLLIAGSNVTNLFLARAAARDHEMSLRLSIGAGRRRLIQQALVESGLLATAASVLGFVFAIVVAPAMVGLMSSSANPAYLDLRPNARLFALLGGLALLTTIAFGLAPALRASGVAPAGALGSAGRRIASRSRLLRPLVAAQVAFSLIVLFVGTLLLLSFSRLTRVDLGFDKSGLLLLTLDARDLKDPGQQRTTAIQLIDHVRRIPGVQSASVSEWALFSGTGRNLNVRLPGRAADTFQPSFIGVSPGFFETMRIPLLRGRPLERSDLDTKGIEAVVVNDAFARRYFDGDAVGRTFDSISGAGTVPQRIVGIAGNTKDGFDLREAPTPVVYTPLRRAGTLQVRTAQDPFTLVPALRREIRAVHPSLAVSDVRLQSTLIDNWLRTDRVLALLAAFFAAVGLMLAAIGLYGVLTYSVVQRTREIGIRMALGAEARAVIRAVVSEAGAMVALGVVGGLGAGLYLARFVRTLLFDVDPLSVWSMALPVGCLIVAALLAALLPAWRAARIDPVIALRFD